MNNELLKEIYDQKLYSFYESANDWRDAIGLSCEILKSKGIINENYEKQIIDCVEKYGSYFVIMPGVAIPHAQENSDGAFKTAVSFTKLKQPVSFEQGNLEKDASIFFTIVSTNSKKHLVNMQRLYHLLMDEKIIFRLQQINSSEEFERFIMFNDSLDN